MKLQKRIAKLRFPLLLLAVAACEPIDNKELALDSNALFDQRPVRAEGWVVEGQSSAVFDGLNLSTYPTSKSDGFTQQEMSLNNTSMTKKFPSLVGLETGTIRMNFRIPKIATSGLKFELNFASGVGLPAELRITDAGLTAKCGFLNLNDGVPTGSAAKVLEIQRDYELRITRTAEHINVLLDNEVLIKDLACSGLQDPNEEPRTAGSLRMTLFSQAPTEPLSWTASEMLLHENQFLVKRITVYKDALLSSL